MRTIDADALLKVLGLGANCEECEESVRGVYCAANPDLMNVCDAIADAPTIEPKRGKWITKKDACGIGYQICSNCETEIQWRDRHGVILRVDMQNAPYCPNCGAKMDEVEE